MPQQPLSVPVFYAQTQGARCEGGRRCHWCGGPCGTKFGHGDPRPLIPAPGQSRNPYRAAYPTEPYSCTGCWLWRRTSVTARYLDGKSFRDRQEIRCCSWLLTGADAWAVRDEDKPQLLEFLVRPELPFALLLLDDPKLLNHAHLGAVNAPAKLEASTPLWFTLNNVLMAYTVYELEEAIRVGHEAGVEPGVTALLRYLGATARRVDLPAPVVPVREEAEGRGRPLPPADAKDLRREVPPPTKATKATRAAGAA